jgi:hypothetical protein
LACDTKPQRASITPDELLIALNGQVFTILTPSKVDSKAFAGLALKYPDGRIDPFSSGNGLKPDQELKVILIDPKKGSLRYAILGDGFMQRGESTNFPGFSIRTPNPISTRIGIDEPLVRFGIGTSSSLPYGDLREGEFDLIFHIQSTSSEQSAPSNGG